MPKQLSAEERQSLLSIAREAIKAAVLGRQPAKLDQAHLTSALLENGASFVTLTKNGNLRGCIGSLEAYQGLAADVQMRAVQAATCDTRFRQVDFKELDSIKIEISRLTPPERLYYDDPAALPSLLHPGTDGVILSDGYRRATFLPQVWEQLPVPEDFLSHLCAKMGASPNLWRNQLLEISIYHVEEFQEA